MKVFVCSNPSRTGVVPDGTKMPETVQAVLVDVCMYTCVGGFLTIKVSPWSWPVGWLVGSLVGFV